MTPLYCAAQYNKNPAVIATLLDTGADPKVRDILGKTPPGITPRTKSLSRDPTPTGG